MLPSFHVLATGISPILGTPLPPIPIWRACPFSGRPDARPALACKSTETVLETVHDSFTVVIPDVGSRDDRNSHPCKVYPIQKHLQGCTLATI